MSQPKFTTGGTYLTRAVADSFEGDAMEQITEIVRRHHQGDWGDVGEDGRRENEAALESQERLLSSYQLKCGGEEVTVWVITDPGWEVTTVLFPSDY